MAWRLRILIISVFIFGLLIIGRLFELQVLRRNFYLEKTFQRSNVSQLIPAERGKIFINDKGKYYPLSVNTKTYNLIASPAEIKDLDEWIKKMSPYLDIYELSSQNNEPILIQENQETDKLKDILIRLSQKNDFYELLKKDIGIEEVEKINSLDLEGINFETVPQRYYPEGSLFSHITGFVSKTESCGTGLSLAQCKGLEGQYGLEEFFNKELSGTAGQSRISKAPGDYLITSSDNIIKSPENGIDIVLTLDRSIQFFTCSTLEKAINEYQAESGSIIITNPKTGAILGLCNKPDFNPNQYSKEKNFEVFKNTSIASAFEPGSIFKVITMAAALDVKKITPETSYIDKGFVQIEDYTIKNVENRVHGEVSMTNVLEKSINTGAVYAVRLVGRKIFRNYVKKFGFGSLTGIELAGEAMGSIDNLDKRAETYLATSSFGHGISMTPLQIVNAVGAIANSGKLMKPYLVESIIENGQENIRTSQFIRQVISPATAATLSAMLVSVLENGYGRRAKVDNYFVAGKTGTAQIPKKDSGYSEDIIHSFVGFAPATDPKFVALVKLDNPKKGKYADSTAAPTFGKIAEFILKYYNILPDRGE